MSFSFCFQCKCQDFFIVEGMADSSDSSDSDTPGSSRHQSETPSKQDKKSKKGKSRKNVQKDEKASNHGGKMRKRRSVDTFETTQNQNEDPDKIRRKRKADDTPESSENENKSPTKQGKKLQKLKNRFDIPGTSTSSNDAEKETKQDKKAARKKNDGTLETNESDDDDIEILTSSEESTDKQDSQEPEEEPKCCKKRCIHVVNPQLQEQLYQEYREQVNRSIEHGRSYLRQYISHSKLVKNRNGKRRNATYHYRIPQQIPRGNDDKDRDICQKAFFKIFKLNEWELRHTRGDFGKCT